MNEDFNIYVDQLRDGEVKAIEEHFSPSFLDIHEDDLAFEKEVIVNGEAYLADQELVLHWSVETEARVACSICNDKVSVPLVIEGAYQSISLAEIKGAVYDFKELLREAILLEVPSFVECHGGSCPKRQDFRKYLKQESPETASGEDGYRPFADLDWDQK